MITNGPKSTSVSPDSHAVALQRERSRDAATLKWVVGPVLAIVVLLAAAGAEWLTALRYDRAALMNGEAWRLLTAHLVHLNLWHATLNVGGAGLLALLFPRAFAPLEWVGISLMSAITIAAGLFFLSPEVDWYVGLSGVLHGALAAGALNWWRTEAKALALTLTVVLIGKLSWEQWYGALPLSGSMPVVVNAHLYGAVGGLASATILLLLRRRARPVTNDLA